MKNIGELDFKVIGARLKEVREKLRLTIDSMRDITGVGKSSISEMENGIKKPSLKYLHGLSIEFNVNVNWLLTGQSTMFKSDIEMNLDFGTEDNKLIKEMVFYLGNVNLVRHDLLRYFIQYKRENLEVLNEYLKKYSDS